MRYTFSHNLPKLRRMHGCTRGLAAQQPVGRLNPFTPAKGSMIALLASSFDAMRDFVVVAVLFARLRGSS